MLLSCCDKDDKKDVFYFKTFFDILGGRVWSSCLWLIVSEACVFLLTGSVFFFSGEKR